jgi:hypothetical protein
MEPVKTKIVIPHVRVESVTHHTYKKHTSGKGNEAVFTEVALGWFILLEGSHEALYVGRERPDLCSGDRVSITFVKET